MLFTGRKLHIFNIADGGAHIGELGFGRIFPDELQVELPYQPENLALVGLQRKGRPADHASIGSDDLSADAVDGPKFKLLCQLGTETLGKALPHVVCGGNGVGDSENLARQDASAQKHVAKACDENRCFAGTGHGQNKDRSIDGLHCLLLLRGQGQVILYQKILEAKWHGGPFEMTFSSCSHSIHCFVRIIQKKSVLTLLPFCDTEAVSFRRWCGRRVQNR